MDRDCLPYCSSAVPCPVREDCRYLREKKDLPVRHRYLRRGFVCNDHGPFPEPDDSNTYHPGPWVREGETLGLVGETGSGKTITGLALLRLIMPPGKIEGGSILFGSDAGTVDLLKISETEMRKIRGSQIAMIFQEPGAALNPVFTIGDQLTEANSTAPP